MPRGPRKVRERIDHIFMPRKIKERVLTDGLSAGLREETKIVPLSIVGRVAKLKKGWYTDRGLDKYNGELVGCLLPPVELLVKVCPRKGVRLLDAGAGEGEFGRDLEKRKKRLGNKTINYQAVDLVESEKNKKVRAFDLSVDRLPRNSFDVIVSVFVFPYVGDKLHALGSLCNALRVGGTLAITDFGEIKINGISFSTKFCDRIERFRRFLGYTNPHLQITFTSHDGILIRKLREGETRMGLHFEGAELASENINYWKLALKKPQEANFIDVVTISTYRI